TLPAVLPGDDVLVYAELPPGSPFAVDLAGPLGASKHAVSARDVELPLLERAAVRAHIDRLARDRDDTTDEKAREQIKQDIIQLSTKPRVLSDFTALLVLETDADYARFHIDRRALSDILAVGPTGVTLLHRSEPVQEVAAAEVAPEPEEGESDKKKSKDEKP